MLLCCERGIFKINNWIPHANRDKETALHTHVLRFFFTLSYSETGNKNMRLVFNIATKRVGYRCCAFCHQSSNLLLQFARIPTSDWINLRRSQSINNSYVTCCKTSLPWASKTRNMNWVVLGRCCDQLHHGCVLERLSLISLAITRLQRSLGQNSSPKNSAVVQFDTSQPSLMRNLVRNLKMANDACATRRENVRI